MEGYCCRLEFLCSIGYIGLVMEKSSFRAEEKRKVEVVLLGQRLALKSNRSESYLQKLANFISDQIEETRKSSRSVSTNQSVLLVALKVADMLKQREDELFELKENISKKANLAINDVEIVMDTLSKHGLINEEQNKSSIES